MVAAGGEGDAGETNPESEEAADGTAFEGGVVVFAFLFFGEDLHFEWFAGGVVGVS